MPTLICSEVWTSCLLLRLCVIKSPAKELRSIKKNYKIPRKQASSFKSDHFSSACNRHFAIFKTSWIIFRSNYRYPTSPSQTIHCPCSDDTCLVPTKLISSPTNWFSVSLFPASASTTASWRPATTPFWSTSCRSYSRAVLRNNGEIYEWKFQPP